MTNDKRFYWTTANEYELFKLAVPHHDELQDCLATQVAEYARARDDLKCIDVLEIGCGTGETTRRILDADARIRVFAVDTDNNMLQQAKVALVGYGDRVIFKSYMDSAWERLLGPDRKFDIVASAYTLHNFERVYRESVMKYHLIPHLRKRGMFVNADKYARGSIVDHWNDLREQVDAFAVFDSINRPDLRKEWTKHYLEDEQTRVWEADERALLSELGFQNVDVLFRKGMESVVVGVKY